MARATIPLHNRVALVFDFDATLAPGARDALIRHQGFDPEEFSRERVRPLADSGWDLILAGFYRLIEASRSDPRHRLTRGDLERVGRELKPYEGVPEMFDRVRRAAREIVPDIEVEFYVLTAGYVDVHRATSIAGEFEAMWGSEFHFDADGAIAFPKQIITFPEKVRYLLQLSKGLGTKGPNAPADVWREVPQEELHVPLDQIVYLGDGGSDMPVFDLLDGEGGIAIGVFQGQKATEWDARPKVHPGRRVENLAPADYREGSELLRSLLLAVESIAKLVALRRLGRGE